MKKTFFLLFVLVTFSCMRSEEEREVVASYIKKAFPESNLKAPNCHGYDFKVTRTLTKGFKLLVSLYGCSEEYVGDEVEINGYDLDGNYYNYTAKEQAHGGEGLYITCDIDYYDENGCFYFYDCQIDPMFAHEIEPSIAYNFINGYWLTNKLRIKEQISGKIDGVEFCFDRKEILWEARVD